MLLHCVDDAVGTGSFLEARLHLTNVSVRETARGQVAGGGQMETLVHTADISRYHYTIVLAV